MSPQDFQEADAPSMLYVNVGYIAVIVIRFSYIYLIRFMSKDVNCIGG